MTPKNINAITVAHFDKFRVMTPSTRSGGYTEALLRLQSNDNEAYKHLFVTYTNFKRMFISMFSHYS
jgi:hypothetical protein